MNTKPFLFASATLNAVLIASLAYSRAANSVPPIVTSVLDAPPALREIVRDRVVTVTNQIVKRLDWRSVESDDYRNYIANLRAIGCPEETIADIIKADVNKLFQSRRKALADSTEGFKFWKSGNPFVASPEQVQGRQELTQEQRALLKNLLGQEPGTDAIPESSPLADVLAFLSPQQQQQVAEARERFKSTMHQSMGTSASPEARRQNMRQGEQQMEQELSQIMSPPEKEEYDLRLSQTAAKMREHLTAFQPTEHEFRGIFKFRKEFEDSVANLAGQPGSEAQKRTAEARFQAQVRSFLGENRFADFQRAIVK